ncbi:enoyl-CoA hydratase, partial [Glaciimonas sp. Cout2]|nr:enoyl-CoA hydratase [Glaciimonas sp. Cout2]
MISAERLERYGLINALVDPGGALAEAMRLARLILANAQMSVAASKRVIVEQRDSPINEMFARQDAITVPVLRSNDER